jgi:L-alanine-DL-glutamate epimerase-like enolase superfamily enzyme
MRITKLETLCLSRMHEPERQWITASYRTVKADCAIVVVHTDEGVTGVGEASAYGGPLGIQDTVEWLAPELVGLHPDDAATILSPNGRGRRYDAAVAGIDCALWDLRGKIAGKPTADLLADAADDSVRLYASSGCRYDWRDRPEQLVDEALEYVDLGYTAMKFRIGTQWAWDGVTVERFLALVREVHAAVDGRMELMLDGNCRLSEAEALDIALELDRLGFAWFEEPIPNADIEANARLNAAVDMPITGGESFTTLEQFRPYLDAGAYDIVQMDAGLCGITELMRIAKVAARYGVDVCPHSWHNILMGLANGHAVAALPNGRVLEQCMIQGPLQMDILAEPPLIKDGRLLFDGRPGLGATLAENLEASFPYIDGGYALTVQR